MIAKKRRPKAAVMFATPPVERGQHDQLVVVNHDPQVMSAKRVQVLLPNRLRKYRAINQAKGGEAGITEVMMQAGEELAATWEAAGLTPRQTVNLLTSGGGYRDISEYQIEARKRLVKALAGDRKPYADLLVSVCCFDQGVPNTRRLRRALQMLAYHYGMIHRSLR